MFQNKSTYYGIFLLILCAIAGISYSGFAEIAYHFVTSHSGDNLPLILSFFEVGLIFLLGFYSFYLAKNIHIPSFVIAIFLGVAAKPFLETILIAQDGNILNVLVAIGATLILFGGGLETPFENFKKLFPKIALLSFPGLLITAILLAYVTVGTGSIMNITITVGTGVLLGAILASTDPAAIVPVLKVLRFKNKDTKDIVVSESALTDVTGTLLTLAFLAIVTVAVKEWITLDTIPDYYAKIVSKETMTMLGKELIFGIIFGIIWYYLLNGLVKFKHHQDTEFEVDSAFFLFVPLMIFALALTFHGSGYLAAFIVGLLFTVHHKIRNSEHFFNQLVEGYMKPMIFILLGALIDIWALIEYAGIGIAVAFIFMFVIRPITVFVSLSAYLFVRGKQKMTVQELLFISFVRETGAIPAVLLVTLQSQMSNSPALAEFLGQGMLEIGMWVILLSLIIEPMLTPFVAKKLGVAEIMTDEDSLEPEKISQTSSAILATRWFTFLERIDTVVDWCKNHQIRNIIVLLCLENKYSEAEEKKVHDAALNKFKSIENNHPDIQCYFVSRKWLLQTNITELADNKNSRVAAIFVGKKMLDYRLSEIKNLQIPLRFMD